MAQDEKLIRWFLDFQAFVQSREEFKPFAGVITAPAEATGDPEALRIIHAKAALHTLYSPEAEGIVLRAIDAYAREVLGLRLPVEAVPADAVTHVTELQKQGYSFLPPLDPAVVASMNAYFASCPVYEKPSNAGLPPVPFEPAESAFNLAHYSESDVLNCPDLMKIATDPMHLGMAQEYLGTVPQVITVAAWWSFARADVAKAAQLFHLDLDDYRFFKFFIYLTDVDEEAC